MLLPRLAWSPFIAIALLAPFQPAEQRATAGTCFLEPGRLPLAADAAAWVHDDSEGARRADDASDLRAEIAKLKADWEEKHAAYLKIMANSGGKLSRVGQARVQKLDAEARAIKARIDALEAQLEALLEREPDPADDRSAPVMPAEDEASPSDDGRGGRSDDSAPNGATKEGAEGNTEEDMNSTAGPPIETTAANPPAWIPPFRVHDPDTDLSELSEEIFVRWVDRSTSVERTTTWNRWLLPPVRPDSARWSLGDGVLIGRSQDGGVTTYQRLGSRNVDFTLRTRMGSGGRVSFEWIDSGSHDQLKASGVVEGWSDSTVPSYTRARVKWGSGPLLMNLIPDDGFRLPDVIRGVAELRWKRDERGRCTRFAIVEDPDGAEGGSSDSLAVDYTRDGKGRITAIRCRSVSRSRFEVTENEDHAFDLKMQQWDEAGRWSRAEFRSRHGIAIIERSWWREEDVSPPPGSVETDVTRSCSSVEALGLDVVDVLDPSLRCPHDSVEIGWDRVEQRFGKSVAAAGPRKVVRAGADRRLPSLEFGALIGFHAVDKAITRYPRRIADRVEFIDESRDAGLVLVSDAGGGATQRLRVYDLAGAERGQIRRWQRVGGGAPEVRIEFPRGTASILLRQTGAAGFVADDATEARIRWDESGRVVEIGLSECEQSSLELGDLGTIRYRYGADRSVEEVRLEFDQPEKVTVGRVVPTARHATGWWTEADVWQGERLRDAIAPSAPPVARLIRSKASVQTPAATPAGKSAQGRRDGQSLRKLPGDSSVEPAQGERRAQATSDDFEDGDDAEERLQGQRARTSEVQVLLALLIVVVGALRVLHRDLTVGRDWPWPPVAAGLLVLAAISIWFMHDAGARAGAAVSTARFASYVPALPPLLLGTLLCGVVPAYLGVHRRLAGAVGVTVPIVGLYALLVGLTGHYDPALIIGALEVRLMPELAQVRAFSEIQGLLNESAAEWVWMMRSRPESATGLIIFLVATVLLVILAMPASSSRATESDDD